MLPKKRVILPENKLAEAAINTTLLDIYAELTSLYNQNALLTQNLTNLTDEMTTLLTSSKELRLSELWSELGSKRVLRTDPSGNMEISLGGAHGATINFKYATTVLSLLATATWTGAIPDGALLLALSTRVLHPLIGVGLTGYQIGDGVDVDRWGDIVGVAAGTSSNNSNWVIGTIDVAIAATDIVLTAVGAAATGGLIRVAIIYLDTTTLSA